jgi:hypothetical protein
MLASVGVDAGTITTDLSAGRLVTAALAP